MNTGRSDYRREKLALEKRIAELVCCHKYKGTRDEQVAFLKELALETAEDLFGALMQWKDAEIRTAKARGEMDEDDYPVDDDKEALISLARGIESLLRGDLQDMQHVLEFASEVFNRTPCNIDTDDEAWLDEHGMNI